MADGPKQDNNQRDNRTAIVADIIFGDGKSTGLVPGALEATNLFLDKMSKLNRNADAGEVLIEACTGIFQMTAAFVAKLQAAVPKVKEFFKNEHIVAPPPKLEPHLAVTDVNDRLNENRARDIADTTPLRSNGSALTTTAANREPAPARAEVTAIAATEPSPPSLLTHAERLARAQDRATGVTFP